LTRGRWRVRLPVLLGVILVLYVLVKYAERKQIYYPTRFIEITPEDAGMEYEEVHLVTADGARLHGWYVPAESSRGVVLFCHGNAGNISHRLDSIIMFRELGLDVFIFDYRGYGKSRGWITEKGLYLDAEAAFDYLVEVRKIPSKKIVIFGRSIGGDVAIDLAARVDAACLITEGAFLSIEDMAKSIYKVRPPGWLLSNHFDALSRIKRVGMPKLIVHSRDDEIVPSSHGRRIFETAGGPKEFLELEGSHNDAFLVGGREYKRRLRDFIDMWTCEPSAAK
jgi:fermentation-respiration switch protein FrsA (DUF1100 family)